MLVQPYKTAMNSAAVTQGSSNFSNQYGINTADGTSLPTLPKETPMTRHALAMHATEKSRDEVHDKGKGTWSNKISVPVKSSTDLFESLHIKLQELSEDFEHDKHDPKIHKFDSEGEINDFLDNVSDELKKSPLFKALSSLKNNVNAFNDEVGEHYEIIKTDLKLLDAASKNEEHKGTTLGNFLKAICKFAGLSENEVLEIEDLKLPVNEVKPPDEEIKKAKSILEKLGFTFDNEGKFKPAGGDSGMNMWHWASLVLGALGTGVGGFGLMSANGANAQLKQVKAQGQQMMAGTQQLAQAVAAAIGQLQQQAQVAQNQLSDALDAILQMQRTLIPAMNSPRQTATLHSRSVMRSSKMNADPSAASTSQAPSADDIQAKLNEVKANNAKLKPVGQQPNYAPGVVDGQTTPAGFAPMSQQPQPNYAPGVVGGQTAPAGFVPPQVYSAYAAGPQGAPGTYAVRSVIDLSGDSGGSKNTK